MEKGSPAYCIAPVFAVALGVVFAVFVTYFVPKDWQQTEIEPWYSRTMILHFTIVMWCVGIAIRGNKLHCGGTEGADEIEHRRNLFICLGLILLLLLSLIGYLKANEALLIVPSIITLLVAYSEVTRGSPFFMISERWK